MTAVKESDSDNNVNAPAAAARSTPSEEDAEAAVAIAAGAMPASAPRGLSSSGRPAPAPLTIPPSPRDIRHDKCKLPALAPIPAQRGLGQDKGQTAAAGGPAHAATVADSATGASLTSRASPCGSESDSVCEAAGESECRADDGAGSQRGGLCGSGSVAAVPLADLARPGRPSDEVEPAGKRGAGRGGGSATWLAKMQGQASFPAGHPAFSWRPSHPSSLCPLPGPPRCKFVPCLTRPAPQVDAVREDVSRRGRHSRSPEAVDAAHCAAVPPPPPPAVEAALRARPQATATLRGSAGPAVV